MGKSKQKRPRLGAVGKHLGHLTREAIRAAGTLVQRFVLPLFVT
jgi:hypothetical protein